MPPQIAILGWGSLLWKDHPAFDCSHDQWRYDGPSLKLEFSRVSASRLRALTLVIDPDHGAPITVAWCLSTRKNPQDAICDLRCREGTTVENIGHLLVADAVVTPPGEEARVAMLHWAKERGLDAVVWTALRSNFSKVVKQPFSVQEAVAHLKRLPAAGKVKAAEYLWRAPAFIKTPLRTAVEKATWFHEPEGSEQPDVPDERAPGSKPPARR